jgi:hypothetical protein
MVLLLFPFFNYLNQGKRLPQQLPQVLVEIIPPGMVL